MTPTPYSGSQRICDAEARQAAAVRDDERERAGLRDTKAEAVPAAAHLDRAAIVARDRRRRRTPDLLHLAQRRTAGAADARRHRAAATPTETRPRIGSGPARSSTCRPSSRTSRWPAAARPSTARPPSGSRARADSAGTLDGSSVVEVMPSGRRTFAVTYSVYGMPETRDTIAAEDREPVVRVLVRDAGSVRERNAAPEHRRSAAASVSASCRSPHGLSSGNPSACDSR